MCKDYKTQQTKMENTIGISERAKIDRYALIQTKEWRIVWKQHRFAHCHRGTEPSNEWIQTHFVPIQWVIALLWSDTQSNSKIWK